MEVQVFCVVGAVVYKVYSMLKGSFYSVLNVVIPLNKAKGKRFPFYYLQ